MPNDQNEVEKCEQEGIPLDAGIITVISYLVLHMIWSRTVFGPYAFVIARVLFLAAVVFYFRFLHLIPLQDIIGRLHLPRGKDRSFFFLILAATVVLRLTSKIAFDFDTRLFSIDAEIDEVIIPSINEELVFRGIVMLSLASAFRQGAWRLVVLSTAIFVAAHFPTTFALFSSLVILGGLLGILFLRTRSITGCMIVHAAWNALSFV